MTVRIVEEGVAELIKYTNCGNCATRLSYVPNDLQERSHRDYLGDLDTWKVIVCPKCGKDASVRR